MNNQQALDETIQSLQTVPTVLLHSCCAVCSSYVLEYLAQYFRITVFYYNPNIYPLAEYQKRKDEQMRLLREITYPNPVNILDADYDHNVFLNCAQGLEQLPEGGERCENCFTLRLGETALRARHGNYDYFATTLTVSPHKNAECINAIGAAFAAQHHIHWLYADFKKKNGYLRSTQLAKLLQLYRQSYCGCEFSLKGQPHETF